MNSWKPSFHTFVHTDPTPHLTCDIPERFIIYYILHPGTEGKGPVLILHRLIPAFTEPQSLDPTMWTSLKMRFFSSWVAPKITDFFSRGSAPHPAGAPPQTPQGDPSAPGPQRKIERVVTLWLLCLTALVPRGYCVVALCL